MNQKFDASNEDYTTGDNGPDEIPSPAECVYKSLLEIHHISEHEIERRKDLLFFTDKDCECLEAMGLKIEMKIDEIVHYFYEKQLSFSEVALLIGDQGTLKRLRTAMRDYILDLFSGYYDAEYVNRRLRIGKVHQRIGVSPKLYVSALNQLKYIIIENIIEANDPDTKRKIAALDKILMFDMQLIFDTYTSSLVQEVNLARNTLENYARSLEEKIQKRTAQLKEISIRDKLTGLYNRRGFYEIIRHELNVTVRNAHPLCLIYIDLNNFKALNDERGHSAGDRLLAFLGNVISSTIREIDHGFRPGGDEFAILLPNTTLESAVMVYNRILKKFDAENMTSVSLSAGIVQSLAKQRCSQEDLIKQADMKMYLAKTMSRQSNGRHATEFGLYDSSAEAA